MMIKIAFFVLDAGWFGHTRTAASIISKFLESGNDVAVVIDGARRDNYISSLLEGKKGVEFFYLESIGQSFPIKDLLCSEAFRELDVVHSFEDCGIFDIIQATSALGLKHVSTVCAPLKQHNYFPVNNTVFLSEEFRETAKQLSRYVQHADVIRCRVSPKVLSKTYEAEPRVKQNVDNLLQRTEGDIVVLRVCQLSAKYLLGLMSVVEGLEVLVSKGIRVKFLHVGRGDKEAQAAFAEKVREVNERLGGTFINSTAEFSSDAHVYMRYADVVIGSGRSAFESMFYGKPCIVVDMDGGGGGVLFSEDSARQLAYYNFSGRKNSECASHARFDAVLESLICNGVDQRGLSDFGRKYFDNNLSDEILLAKYRHFYSESDLSEYNGMYWLLYGSKHLFLRMVRWINSLV